MTSVLETPLVKQLTPARPLVPVDVVMFCLQLGSIDAVKDAILTGRIAWAWDLRSPASRRHEIRVYWRCVTGEACRQTEAEVYHELIPTHWERFAAATLYRRWWCSQELLASLAATRELTQATDAARGPEGSPAYTRESAIAFLKKRRLGQ